MKNYTNLSKLKTFEERFAYLKLDGRVGDDTFGFDRYLNQNFYRSVEWRALRNQIILRDLGCDLGLDGYTIFGKVLIHHMNPITPRDVLEHSEFLMNPEFLICVSPATHNAIHYGDPNLIPHKQIAERRPGDTCPWKQN